MLSKAWVLLFLTLALFVGVKAEGKQRMDEEMMYEDEISPEDESTIRDVVSEDKEAKMYEEDYFEDSESEAAVDNEHVMEKLEAVQEDGNSSALNQTTSSPSLPTPQPEPTPNTTSTGTPTALPSPTPSRRFPPRFRPFRPCRPFRPTAPRCPFQCRKVCVVPRLRRVPNFGFRYRFRWAYTCNVRARNCCQQCCASYARCRRRRTPEWLCYARGVDCTCSCRGLAKTNYGKR